MKTAGRRNAPSSLKRNCLALLMGVALSSSVLAQQPAATPQQYAIPSGDLAQVVNEISRSSGLQIVYDIDDLRGLQSAEVKGNLTLQQALDKALKGSGLSWAQVNPTTISIRKQEKSEAKSIGKDPAAASGSDIVEMETMVVRGVSEILSGSSSQNVDIRRTEDDMQPYIAFDRETIERSGSVNVEDFLRARLTPNSAPLSQAQSNGAGGSNASAINLRGLGAAQTLILIDGRRVAPRNNGGSLVQADLNGIPLSAIERIEVLPATASGIYGGGATGGVVNVILRRDYSGLETTLNYDSSFEGGGSRRRIDLAGGFPLEGGRTNITFAGAYSDSTELQWGDRNILERARSRILANNPNALLGAATPPLGATTNIRSSDGQNLTLKGDGTALGSLITYVPYGYAGINSDGGAALVGNAGHYNLDAPHTAQLGAGALQSLLNTPTSASLMASVRREFAPWLDAYLDLSASKNSGYVATDPVTGRFALPASAASNPFNQPIIISTPAFGTDQEAKSTNYDYKGVVGLIFKLPREWRATTDYTWNRVRTETTLAQANLSPVAATAVANGLTTMGAPFDVFRDTNIDPITFTPYLGGNYVSSPLQSMSQGVAMRVAGPVGWSLPGGHPTLSLLLERRKDSLNDSVLKSPTLTLTTFSRSQVVNSLYIETFLPLISARNQVPGVKALELQLAVRRDDYSIVGANSTIEIPGVLEPSPVSRITQDLTSTDPMVGVRYQPVSDLTFRASYATGFLPPDLAFLVPDAPSELTGASAGGLTDPLRNNEVLGTFTNLNGGNPNLRPEESKSASFGVILTPRFLPGFRFSADWIRIKKSDNVRAFAPTQLNINNEAAIPGFIARGPASDGFSVGPITAINSQYLNVSRQDLEALDVAMNYRRETETWGDFTISMAGTRNFHNFTQVFSTAPEIELLGSLAVLKWRANVEIMWQKREWTARWQARYFDSYCLLSRCAAGPSTLSQGSLTIPRQIYHDLSIGYQFMSMRAGFLSGVEVNLGFINILNKKPPVDLSSVALYSTYGDPRLARYQLTIKKTFF